MAKVDTFIGSTLETRFGSILTIGWDGERQGKAKKYTVSCSVCGDGFKSVKSSLVSGSVPCDCAYLPR